MKLQVKTVMDIRTSLHSQVCRVRSILRLSESDSFQVAFNAASEEERLLAVEFINNSDQDGLSRWVKRQLHAKKIVEEYTVRELRQLGQQLGVKDYNVLPKTLLISAIKAAQKPREQA